MPTAQQSQEAIKLGLEGSRLSNEEVQQRLAALPSPQEVKNLREIQTNEAKVSLDLRRQQLEKTKEEVKALRAAPGVDFKTVDSLARRWNSDPITQASKIGKVAVDKVLSYRDQTPSAAGDHSLIFNYMKTVDPGSTVREGEFNTVEQAGGIVDRVSVGILNKTFAGEMLTPTQRADFISKTETLWEQQVKMQNTIDNEYRRLARERKLPENQVVLDLGLGEPKKNPFTDADIKAVMEATGASRQDAILRLKAAAGGAGQ
jgi:hypothetical protein